MASAMLSGHADCLLRCAMVVQAVTFGDVNGDGELEVVFGTTSGYLYAVSGKTGLNIPNFPFKTHGRIAASVLITQLSQGLSQQLVVMSFDGHLYMVDGISGALCCCAALCCAVLRCAVLCDQLHYWLHKRLLHYHDLQFLCFSLSLPIQNHSAVFSDLHPFTPHCIPQAAKLLTLLSHHLNPNEWLLNRVCRHHGHW